MAAKVGHPSHVPNLLDKNGGVSPTLPNIVLESRLDTVYLQENMAGIGRSPSTKYLSSLVKLLPKLKKSNF
jgi:hypothetical protein